MLILKNRLIMAVLVLAQVVSMGLTLVKYAFLRLHMGRDSRL